MVHKQKYPKISGVRTVVLPRLLIESSESTKSRSAIAADRSRTRAPNTETGRSKDPLCTRSHLYTHEALCGPAHQPAGRSDTEPASPFVRTIYTARDLCAARKSVSRYHVGTVPILLALHYLCLLLCAPTRR